MSLPSGTLRLALAFLLGSFAPGHAGEGGGSHYVPGSLGEFLLGVFGPPGIYTRNDIWHLDYDVGRHIRNGRTVLNANQSVTLNTLRVSYLSDQEIFGARYGASIALSYVLDANVSTKVAAGVGDFTRGTSTSGLSDPYIAPLLLNWAGKKQHATFKAGFYAPWGTFDADKAINTSRNYWTYDIGGSYTWIDPASGFEFSATGSYLINTENPDTDYRSGNEVHINWTVAQHFSKAFTAGISGYYYTQVEADEGKAAGPLDGSDIKAWSYGIGPSMQLYVPVGGKPMGIIAKALFDLDAQDRLSGNMYMLSATYAF